MRYTVLFLALMAWQFCQETARADLPPDLQAEMSHAGDALLIGVWKYNDRRWGSLPPVQDELQELAKGLEPHFQHIQTLENPNVDVLRHTLRDFLIGRASQGIKRLFVFYAGHGFTDFNQASRSTDGYVTGTDTPAYDPNDPSAISSSLSFQEIDAMNRESRAMQIFMAFDSCFSGSIFMTRSTNLNPTHYDYDRARSLLSSPGRYYVTAGGPTDLVPADSPFARLLLRGLGGDADIFHVGFVTAEELGIYLKQNMPNYSHQSLNPQSGPILDANLSKGQFVFSVLPENLPLPAQEPPRAVIPANLTPGLPTSALPQDRPSPEPKMPASKETIPPTKPTLAPPSTPRSAAPAARVVRRTPQEPRPTAQTERSAQSVIQMPGARGQPPPTPNAAASPSSHCKAYGSMNFCD
jgi:hypothetical protein